MVDSYGRFFCALDCAWSRTIADEEAVERQRRAYRERMCAQARHHLEMQSHAERVEATAARRASAAKTAKAAKAQRAAARAANAPSCLKKGDEKKRSSHEKKSVRFSTPSAEASPGGVVDLDKSEVYHAMFQLDPLFDFGLEGGGGGKLRV